jgi:hypothetical protein
VIDSEVPATLRSLYPGRNVEKDSDVETSSRYPVALDTGPQLAVNEADVTEPASFADGAVGSVRAEITFELADIPDVLPALTR